MLWAQLRGKVPIHSERSEDLLTSNVFGTLKYVPFQGGIYPVLSAAVGDCSPGFHPLLQGADEVQFEFWPWLERWAHHGCEPDVLLRLTKMGRNIGFVLVEAKYLSGKSSVADPAATAGSAPRDQLAREWVNVQRLADEQKVPAFLLFVTADAAFPLASFRETQEDLTRCGLGSANLLWLSWTGIARALARDRPILQDLCTLLEGRYGFRAFAGLTASVSRLEWQWVQRIPETPRPASWVMEPLTWRFGQ